MLRYVICTINLNGLSSDSQLETNETTKFAGTDMTLMKDRDSLEK